MKSAAAAPPELEAGWAKLLRMIPGYDPIESAEEGDWFDPDLAQNALHFFEHHLILTKDTVSTRAGSPFVLQLWEAAIVANIVGWRRIDSYGNNVRRYKECFVGIPRKNGKTELCAGLGNLFFFTDEERGIEICCGAKDRPQAAKLFSAAKLMVTRSRKLSSECGVYAKALYKEDGSSFMAVSADAAGQHGGNPHVAIVDELHVHVDGRLVEAFESGQGSRRSPLMMYLTTQDYDRKDSICNELWDHARKVRDGQAKISNFLPVLYEADEALDDWEDEEVWKRVNPNLNVSVSIDFLREQAQKAKHLPRLRNQFKRLHLNIRTGQSEVWLPMDKWDECDGRMIPEKWDEDGRLITVGDVTREMLEKSLAGKRCWVGVDLSQKYDMTAAVFVFRDERDGQVFYWLLPYFWLPEETIKDPARDVRKRDIWQQWHRDGYLFSTPGKTVSYPLIRKFIMKRGEDFNIQKIGIDRWNAGETADALELEGYDVEQFRPFFSAMSGPSKEFESAVMSGRIVHMGHPILREQARVCACVQNSNEDIRPAKDKSGDKIDGIVASIIGVGLASLGGQSESMYETHGFRTT